MLHSTRVPRRSLLTLLLLLLPSLVLAKSTGPQRFSDLAPFEWLSWIAGAIGLVLLTLLFVIIAYMIMRNRIDLKTLLLGNDGTASFARFQMLVFTFVVAFGLLVTILKDEPTTKILEGNVLLLLGISGGTYVLSKSIGLKKTPPTDATTLPPAGQDTTTK